MLNPDYKGISSDIITLLENARRHAARSLNALMTATYWEIGRRIVAFEQNGEALAGRGPDHRLGGLTQPLRHVASAARILETARENLTSA
jgi:hypothetical protein